jgi:hypothetical protein
MKEEHVLEFHKLRWQRVVIDAFEKQIFPEEPQHTEKAGN